MNPGPNSQLLRFLHECHADVAESFNFKLKTRPNQLLGSLLLDIALPDQRHYEVQRDENLNEVTALF
jgi:hypothetical protein